MNLITSLSVTLVIISVATKATAEATGSDPADVVSVADDRQPFDAAVADKLDWGVGGVAPSPAAAQYLSTCRITDEATVKLAYNRKTFPQKWTEALLRAQLAAPDLSNKDKPRITFALAFLLKTRSSMPSIAAQFSSEQMERAENIFGEADYQFHLNAETAPLADEAKRLLAELIEQHHAEVLVGDVTYGTVAKSTLFEMEHLTIGKIAPDIDAEDLDGVQFKLSDYRGKVVLLTFWATWCGPCMQMIPAERELAERFADKPFAIVGVNSDPDKSEVAAAIKEHGITWRSFWCGEKGPLGELPISWSVSSWPTTYLLDAKGVIRAKSLQEDRLAKMIEELLQQAAHEAK